MKVLAISAWKRSGKDSLCDYLIKKGAVRVAFADPLKDRVAEEYGISRADLDDQSKKESPILHLPVEPQDSFTRSIVKLLLREFRTKNGKMANDFDFETNEGLISNDGGILTHEILYWSPRSLAIFKGSANRAVASNYWVQQAIQQVKYENQEGVDLVIIPDLRYKSEISQLREAFGNKLTTIRINRFETSPSVDPSERDLDNADFDHIIENKGTLEEFYDRIDSLVKELKL